MYMKVYWLFERNAIMYMYIDMYLYQVTVVLGFM